MPCTCTGTSTLGLAQGERHGGADAPADEVVLDDGDGTGAASHRDEVVADRQHPARVDGGDRMSLRLELARDVDGHGREGTDPDEEQVARSRRRSRGARRRRPSWRTAATAGPTSPLGKRITVGPSVTSMRLAQLALDLVAVAGRGQPQAGDDRGDRHVPHAVVRGAVAAGDARAVEDEGDARLVQRAVHQQLVEGPVEEGGVDRDDRMQAGIRQAAGHGDGVLLGDARRRRRGRGRRRRSRRGRPG